MRAVARGLGPDATAGEVMNADVKYCYDDETTEHIAQNMAAERIRRLPVVNRCKRLAGVVSPGDLATGGVSAAPHRQGAGRHLAPRQRPQLTLARPAAIGEGGP